LQFNRARSAHFGLGPSTFHAQEGARESETNVAAASWTHRKDALSETISSSAITVCQRNQSLIQLQLVGKLLSGQRRLLRSFPTFHKNIAM